MTTRIESSREATMAILAVLDGQHRVAVESGNGTLCEAILAQTEHLYSEAAKSEESALNEARELAEAHSTLFLLKLKGVKTRIQHQTEKLNREQQNNNQYER